MLDNPNSVLYARKGTGDLFLHITSTYKSQATTLSRIYL